jgi:hypothetical protein
MGQLPSRLAACQVQRVELRVCDDWLRWVRRKHILAAMNELQCAQVGAGRQQRACGDVGVIADFLHVGQGVAQTGVITGVGASALGRNAAQRGAKRR